MMRLFSIVILAGLGVASAYTAAHPSRVFGIYEGMYPSDPYKREALQICYEHDHEFNRADADSRDACYRRVLAGPNPMPNPQVLAPPRDNEPNFIDLYHASGQGHLSQGDVRATQQSDRYLHPH
jgi:hypothetical protein